MLFIHCFREFLVLLGTQGFQSLPRLQDVVPFELPGYCHLLGDTERVHALLHLCDAHILVHFSLRYDETAGSMERRLKSDDGEVCSLYGDRLSSV